MAARTPSSEPSSLAGSSTGCATPAASPRTSSGSSRGHAFHLDGPIDGLRARRFLAAHGEELARDLLDHKEADLRSKAIAEWELPALERFRAAVESERGQPLPARPTSRSTAPT